MAHSAALANALQYDTLREVCEKLSLGATTSTKECQLIYLRLKAWSEGNPFSYQIEERALLDAKASDTRREKGCPIGPLDGVPVCVKDVLDVVPAACSAGLAHLEEYRPSADSDVVKILRKAGAVVLGVTKTDSGAFGTQTLTVRNPLSRGLIAGGSSGGSGAAVAGGVAVCGIGTDTGGSIRIPSACCSVAGFKPTYGRVPTGGLLPLSKSFDHVGPIASSVRDLAIVQAVLDPLIGETDAPRKAVLRVGFPLSYYDDAHHNIKGLMEDCQEVLAKGGHQVVNPTLPNPDTFMGTYREIAAYEAASYHTEKFPDKWEDYPPAAAGAVAFGKMVSKESYDRAKDSQRVATSRIDDALADVDCILLPTMPMDTPLRVTNEIPVGGNKISIVAATIRYTYLFNVGGHPTVVFPILDNKRKRAGSVQVVGARNSDRHLLRMAEQIQDLLMLSL